VQPSLVAPAPAAATAATFSFGAADAAPVQPRATYRRRNVSGTDPEAQRAVASYKNAIRAMLALPPSDPCNCYRIALTHSLDCAHGNWWFLVWHRGYLGWFEQICREQSHDPNFALPYWDWTAEPRVPAVMFDDVLDPGLIRTARWVVPEKPRSGVSQAALGNWRCSGRAWGVGSAVRVSVMALKVMVASVQVLLLFSGSAVLFSKTRTISALLQLLGAACLMVVVLTHICEALELLPWMGWGLPDSAGHYLDLGSAVLGLALFPVGFLWHSLTD
jgi:hypothetical protein